MEGDTRGYSMHSFLCWALALALAGLGLAWFGFCLLGKNIHGDLSGWR